MQFASGLVGSGWEPEEMQVECAVSFEVGMGVTQSALTARVTVDGLTDQQIFEIAQRAKIMCPISRALTGIEITLDLPDLVLDDEDEEAEEGVSTDSACRGLRWPGHVQSRTARRGARALLPGGAGPHVGSCGLQRPPRGGGGRAAAEEARGAAPPRAGVAAGARRPRGREGRPRARRVRPRQRGRGRSARGGAEALARRERPGRREGRDRRGAPGRRRRRGGALGGRPGPDARALRRAPRLQVGAARGQRRTTAPASRKASTR